jgi:glucosyl-dolichyl phosphate glucuronosyltransferase
MITVILCTFNRCRDLEKALASVAASEVTESVQWEVLITDNNSNDRTPEVADEFCRRYPGRFRYLFEPQPGKAHALNSAVREAQGEILAFMDDDASVEPTWLENLTSAFQNARWAGAGGRIVLQWPSALPQWLSIEGPYSRHPFPGFDQGSEAKEITSPLFGANMAFRKSMFEKYGAFRTDLGPSPNRDIPPPSEDTEFGRRLIAAGERLWYQPSAVVHHPIAQTRINTDYFLSWWFDMGRAEIRESGAKGVSLRLLSRLAVWTLRWAIATKPQVRFYRKLVVWQKAGQIVESYRRSKHENRRVDAERA